MTINSKTIMMPALIAALSGLVVTGCGQARNDTTGSEAVSEPVTAAVTEAPIVIQTDAPQTETETAAPVVTEVPETQPQTQSETQPQTQAETTPVTEAVLTADEELAQENDYTDWVTMYANDDINIRTSPDTSTQDNIVSSYDKGEEAVIAGETPNWFVIYKDYDPVSELSELTGYVRKEYISSTYEDAVSDSPVGSGAQPRSQETAAAETADTDTAAADTAAAETAAPETAAPETTGDTAAEEAVSADQTQAAPSSGEVSGTAVTVNSDANIRSDAYETASVVGVVNAGTTVTQIGSADGWVQIDYNGVQGYINASFVS